MSKSVIGSVKPDTFANLRPRMLAAGLPPERVQRELSFAVQSINQSKYLQQCDVMSVMMAVVNCANIGLTLNPASKEAYLIPRNGRAVFDASYVGLTKLIVQSGLVRSIVANVVYEPDTFELNVADNRNPVKHSPFLKPGRTETERIGYYAIATLIDGSRQPEWMDMQQINAVRDCSDSYKAFKKGSIKENHCPWILHADEMGRKTVVKRIYKYLPRTGDGHVLEKIDKVIQIDDQDYGITMKQHGFIESLLMGSSLPFEETQKIYQEMGDYTHSQASDCIARLKAHQNQSLARQGDTDQAIAETVAKDDYYEGRKTG